MRKGGVREREKVRTSKETMTEKKEKRKRRGKGRKSLLKKKQGMPLHQKETNKIPFKP
jgi:hypothetical protein